MFFVSVDFVGCGLVVFVRLDCGYKFGRFGCCVRFVGVVFVEDLYWRFLLVVFWVSGENIVDRYCWMVFVFGCVG